MGACKRPTSVIISPEGICLHTYWKSFAHTLNDGAAVGYFNPPGTERTVPALVKIAMVALSGQCELAVCMLQALNRDWPEKSFIRDTIIEDHIRELPKVFETVYQYSSMGGTEGRKKFVSSWLAGSADSRRLFARQKQIADQHDPAIKIMEKEDAASNPLPLLPCEEPPGIH